MVKEDKIFELVPRWCSKEDMLKGWVIVHIDQRPAGIDHLNYIKLESLNTQKKIYCRLFGAGSGSYFDGSKRIPNRPTPKGIDVDKVDFIKHPYVIKSIFMDAHYQQLLGMKSSDFGKKVYKFKFKKISRWRYYLFAAIYHPDDGVRIGTSLGILGAVLGALSIVLGIISLMPHATS